MQQHLRSVMAGLGMTLLGGEAYVTFKPNLIDDHGSIGDESTKAFLQGFVDRFATLVARLAPEAERRPHSGVIRSRLLRSARNGDDVDTQQRRQPRPYFNQHLIGHAAHRTKAARRPVQRPHLIDEDCTTSRKAVGENNLCRPRLYVRRDWADDRRVVELMKLMIG